MSSEPECCPFTMRHGKSSPAPVPHEAASYFDVSPRDLASDVRQDIILGLEAMGIKVERAHHAVASGKQRVIRCSGRVSAVPSGLPFHGRADEACACPDRCGGPHGRLLQVLLPRYETPVYICRARMKCSALVGIPRYSDGQEEKTRLELHCRDPSCNPYLAYAAMPAAGLEGIKHKLTPPPPVEGSVYDFSDEKLRELSIDTLPGSLIEALGELERDEVLRETLGEHVYEAFMRAKETEWNQYRSQVTQWELDHCLKFL